MPSKEALSKVFTSKTGFIDLLRVNPGPEHEQPTRWINKDLKPTSPEQRTWLWYHLPLFWGGLAFGTTGWNVGSSLIAVGMTWEYALCSCLIGCVIAAIAVTLLARPGAVYHIGYPVFLRSVFGFYGSFLFICLRLMTGLFWLGISTYSGGNLISTCLLCMFGHRWRDLENKLPASADITSKQLLCFFIAWIIQFPFLWVHPTKIQWFFTLKGFVMPVVTFGLFGFCMAEGRGISSLDTQEVTEMAEDVPLGWAIMAGINTIMGTLASLAVTQPDLSRYCRKSSYAGWPEGVAVFVSKTLVFFLGLASTASIQGVWGTAYWNIWDLLDAILDHYWTPGARCAVFLVSLGFYFSVIVQNIGTNTIAFGADLTGMIPQFMTIKRGQVLCGILGIALVPWKILASASSFVTFLGAVPVFFGPLAGLMIFDYQLIRRGNIHVPSLYTGSKSIYWYTSSTNWRAILAWACGMSLGLPGMIGLFQPSAVGLAATNMYRLGWILTFTTAGFIYLVLCWIFPVQIYPARYRDAPKTYEYMGRTDGYFEDELDDVAQGVIEGVDVTTMRGSTLKKGAVDVEVAAKERS